MTRPRLHIITSCTDRKRVEVLSALRLRTVRGASLEERAATWWRKLETFESPRTLARDVYAGEHWVVSQRLQAVAVEGGFDPVLWVASAGYGLIPAHLEIKGYSATFASGQRDSVADAAADDGCRIQHQTWWRELAAQKKGCRHSRTIEEFATQDPRSRLLVIGSPAYVGALEEDLVSAKKRLFDPSTLVIVTSRISSDRPTLIESQVHSSTRLLSKVGGTRIGLHARVAEDILRNAPRYGFDASALREHYRRVSSRCEPAPTFDREPMSDEAVRSFIRQSGFGSYSAALRQFRSSGYACEQKRFRHLFQSVETRS